MDNAKSTRWVSRVEIMEKLTSSEAQARFRGMSGAEAYNEFLLMLTGVPTYDLVPAGVCNGCWFFRPRDDNEELCRSANAKDCPCKIGMVSIHTAPGFPPSPDSWRYLAHQAHKMHTDRLIQYIREHTPEIGTPLFFYILELLDRFEQRNRELLDYYFREATKMTEDGDNGG